MGYRSDVRILTTERGAININNYVEKNGRNDEEKALWRARRIAGETERNGRQLLLLAWEWTKWYGDFGGDLIEEACRHSGEPYGFARLGEADEEVAGDLTIYWYKNFDDEATLDRPSVDLRFSEDDQREIERTAKELDCSVHDITAKLAGLYQANLYEDLKEIKKGL